jgi:hypothetical protein
MSSDPKKPGVAFWATVVAVVVLVVYPLGIGPIEWLFRHHLLGESVRQVLLIVYLPIIWAHEHGPGVIRRVLDWYMGFWH